VRRIAVRTADFRLSFHLMRELKRRGCDFVMLNADSEFDGIWLATPEEVIAGEGGIPVIEETVEAAVERAIQLSRGLGDAMHLVFGVDPGPRPGLAWIADGVLVGVAQLETVESVVNHIGGLANSLEHRNLVIKVGDGAPLIRDRIINDCLLHSMHVIEVIERRTSRGSRSRAHIHAATRIAMMGGKRVHSIRQLEPTDGDLREIQRQSRIESGGRVTISSELAHDVAVGSISMADAIKRA